MCNSKKKSCKHMYLNKMALIKLLNFRRFKSHSLFTTLSCKTPLYVTWISVPPESTLFDTIFPLFCFFSVRTHAIKFMEMLILTHSKKPTPLPGDYNMKKDDVSIDIVCITIVVFFLLVIFASSWNACTVLKNAKTGKPQQLSISIVL